MEALAIRRHITINISFPADIPRWYADISRLQAIGFVAQIPLRHGLAQTIAWLDEQHQSMELRNLAQGS
jgi:hypothetical protein